jgi:hypothetical protein
MKRRQNASISTELCVVPVFVRVEQYSHSPVTVQMQSLRTGTQLRSVVCTGMVSYTDFYRCIEKVLRTSTSSTKYCTYCAEYVLHISQYMYIPVHYNRIS